MDPTYLEIESTQLTGCMWRKLFQDIDEPILPNAPEILGKIVDFNMFVCRR